jgi:hypothetical protein
MKTRGIVFQGRDLAKIGMPSATLLCRLSMFGPMVHSRSITEDKDVAGMAE